MPDRDSVAVIGCGVAGLTAAHILQRQYNVTIFEKNEYLGGHTHTVAVPGGPDAGTPVDTGFIVCNDQTYPLFHRLLDQLGVSVRTSDMSFSYHDQVSGFQYAGTGWNGLFAQRRNLLRPRFWGMLRDIARFCRNGQRELDTDNVPNLPASQYVALHGYSRPFVEWYLAPMMAAIWSTGAGEVLDFPTEALLRFFQNHGLLSLKNRPSWQTVVGGSHAYVHAFRKRFAGDVRTSCQVRCVRRTAEAAWVTPAEGAEERFDRIVIATHADQALDILVDPSPDERRLLGAWHYQDNNVVLHTDAAALPSRRRAWASWNYAREDADELDTPVSVTYDMNRLQGLQTRERYCVSLNRRRAVDSSRVVRRLCYAHPTYTIDSMATQRDLPKLNGVQRTYFCGSYFSYGFHEDAVRSAVAVGKAFDLTL